MKRARVQFEGELQPLGESTFHKVPRLEDDAFRSARAARVPPAPTLPRGRRALCGACKCVVTASQANHDECLKEFLSQCGAVEKNLSAIRNALFFAIGQGNLCIVRSLLDFDIQTVNLIQHNAVTPLHMSAGAGQVEVMKELIRRGADIHLQLERDHLTALHICASFGSVDCLRFLLQQGADPLQRTSESSMNALHFAAYNGRLECVQALLDHGMDINAISETSHRSALHFALCRGEVDCFKLLVARGADLSLADINGHSALFCLPLESSHLKFDLLHYFPLAERKRWFTYALVDVEKPTYHLQECRRGSLLGDLCDSFEAIAEQLAPATETLFERIPFFEVAFADEMGSGAGVRKEWFSMLEDELLELAVLQPCGTDGALRFAPCAASLAEKQEQLLYASVLGIVFALALVYGHPAPFEFPPHIYKLLLGLQPALSDVKDIDAGLYHGKFAYLLQCPDDELEALQLPFSVAEATAAGRREVELVPGGCDRLVTVDNLPDYLRLCSEHVMWGGSKPLVDQFVAMFHRCVPQGLLAALFTLEEIASSFKGERGIDTAEWERTTKYVHCSPTDARAVWFWRIVNELAPADQSNLLSFCTGSRSLPLGGFERLQEEQTPFTIQLQAGLSPEALPTAHTCFNTLVIPQYTSQQAMATKLKTVLEAQASGVGFSFV